MGTRLKEAVPNLPKCMAPVAGHPFLYYVIHYLNEQGIQRIIFSLGYKHEIVEAYLAQHFSSLDYSCVIEAKPLQTGGAIRFALQEVIEEDVVVMNGDTLFKVDLDALASAHQKNASECTLTLKPMKHFDRYGAVITNDDDKIVSFEEKRFLEDGNINGGVYALSREKFMSHEWPEVFSFEVDYLSRYAGQKPFYGLSQDAYFIDIGVPLDYDRAQDELKETDFPFRVIDQSWTLFLDRDGVINVNKDEGYILNREEFKFTKGAQEAIAGLSAGFGRVIIVTNQRGVGRGLMTADNVDDIHAFMQEEIEKFGGRVDAVFYCTATENDHADRKPNPGMALQARAMFPEIDFSKAIVIGDKSSDLKLGRNIGAQTVFVTSPTYASMIDASDADLTCHSLYDFYQRYQYHR